MSDSTTTKAAIKRPRRMAREPKSDANLSQAPAKAPAAPGPANGVELVGRSDKPQTKADRILGLLRREEGATLEQLIAATGWLPHTTRAALTGIKRKGHVLSSEQVEGMRTYRVAPDGGTA
jgi:hypothetical protein